MIELQIGLGLSLLLIVFLLLEIRKLSKRKPEIQPVYNTTTHQIDLAPIKKVMEDVPRQVLQTIQGSTNNLKGDLGEMIAYLKLHASYDRVIPFGNITDFICIRFPKEGIDGTIDFLDVKTGNARLSKDQRALQKLIQEKKIQLLKLKIETDSGENNNN